MEEVFNDQLVLIMGESGTGKSASLRNLPDQEKKMYLNCEAGKRLPFRNKFNTFNITDPEQVREAVQAAEDPEVAGEVDTVIIDTLTFMMDQYESQYVLPAKDTQKAWGDFAQFFKGLMQQDVAASTKSIICLAHTKTEIENNQYKTSIPIKGALKGNGLEAYFSTAVAVKKMALRDLEPYREGNELLHITEQDEMLGYKHVFQTQLTKDTVGERIRAPMGMFTRAETFMDNDAALLLNRLDEYYHG